MTQWDCNRNEYPLTDKHHDRDQLTAPNHGISTDGGHAGIDGMPLGQHTNHADNPIDADAPFFAF